LFGANAALVLLMMSALWLASIPLRNVSIVDPWWSMGFLLVTAHTAWRTGVDASKLVLLGAVALWALRLWWHLLRRSLGKPEDVRYAAFRQKYGPERYWWFSFFQVFLLQGVLMLVISLPLQAAAAAPTGAALSVLQVLGLAVFAIGFGWEAVADAQLQRFREDPSKRGAVLNTGLWRTSRHPNYFGEAVLHWGLWLWACAAPQGVWCVFAPALMTFLLLRVSGVTLLDAHLLETRPGYADYVARTSAFFPRPPR
jgi:steroid 5-alpha reductase family enzyme